MALPYALGDRLASLANLLRVTRHARVPRLRHRLDARHG